MITARRERKREREGGGEPEGDGNNMSNAWYRMTKTNEIYLYVPWEIRMIRVTKSEVDFAKRTTGVDVNNKIIPGYTDKSINRVILFTA